MTGKADIIKGRIKEAAGVLVGSERLREEGQTDQATGKVKEVANRTVRDAKEAAHTVVAKARRAARQAIDEAKRVVKELKDEKAL